MQKLFSALKALLILALGLVAAFCLLAITIGPVSASQCWESKTPEAMAREQWEQVLAMEGTAQGGDMIRVYRDAGTGAWTITIVRGDHECVMSAGDGWRRIQKPGDPI